MNKGTLATPAYWHYVIVSCNDHRYVNFTFNGAGGGCQNTGTWANNWYFTYFQCHLTYF